LKSSALVWGLILPLLMILLAGCAQSVPRNETSGAWVTLRSNLRAEDAQAIVREADAAVRSTAEFLGVALPPKPAKILLFGSAWSRWRHLSRECPRLSHAGGACFEKPSGKFVIALSKRWTKAETLRYLRHELTHFVVASRYEDIPPWLDEGLAKFFELGGARGGLHPKCLKSLKRQLRGKGAPILGELAAVPPGRGLTRKQYDQAWGLTWYLLTRPGLGPDKVRDYMAEVKATGDPEDQFRRHFGASPADLEPAWRNAMMRIEK